MNNVNYFYFFQQFLIISFPQQPASIYWKCHPGPNILCHRNIWGLHCIVIAKLPLLQKHQQVSPAPSLDRHINKETHKGKRKTSVTYRQTFSLTCPWHFCVCLLHSSYKCFISCGFWEGSVMCFLVLVFFFFFFTLPVQKRLSFTFWRVALIAQCSAFSLPLFHTVTILSVYIVKDYVLLFSMSHSWALGSKCPCSVERRKN